MPDLPFVHLKVLGSLGQSSQYRELEEPFWTHRLSDDSSGRISADVAPFDKAGLNASEALQMARLGVITFLTVAGGLVAAEDPEASASDLPGMNLTVEETWRASEAWRPVVARVFSERYGLDVEATMSFPAQLLFCVDKIGSFRDLAGRTVRTSTVAQTYFVEALGGHAVLMPLAEAGAALASGTVGCVITSALTGNLLGLYHHAHYLYADPVNWGEEFVLGNHKAIASLEPGARAFLADELKALERNSWRMTAIAMQDGLACNIGDHSCVRGTPADMVLVPVDPGDKVLVRDLLVHEILPRWAERCGPDCAADWNRLIGGPAGIAAAPER